VKTIKSVLVIIGTHVASQVLGYLAVRKIDKYLEEKEGQE
jgi:hypothetical protein